MVQLQIYIIVPTAAVVVVMASLVALICVSVIVSSTARNVIVTDGNVLKNYLCHPDDGIMPANTTFVLSKPVLTIPADSPE